MAEATIYATNSGYVSGDAEDTYANVHDRSGDSATNNASPYVGQEFADNPPDWFFIGRGGIILDLSPYAGTVSAATLTLTQAENLTNDTGFDLTLLTGDDLADTLVAADFNQLHDRTTSFGTAAVASGDTTQGTTYGITINATGLAYIETKMGGTLRLALRSSRDISTTTPKLNGAASYAERITLYGSNAAESNKPKLTITYTPSGAFSRAFIIG